MKPIASKTALRGLSCYAIVNPSGLHVANLHVWFSRDTTALRADLYHTAHSRDWVAGDRQPDQFYVRGGGMSALLAKMVIDGEQLYDHGDTRSDTPENSSHLNYLNFLIMEHGVYSPQVRVCLKRLETNHGLFPRNAYPNVGVTEGYGSLQYYPEFRRLEVMGYTVICALQS